jgi:sulfur relay protein TusB/DsrH
MLLYQITTPDPNAILSLAGTEDAVLLRQDAVYLLKQQLSWPTTQLFVLEQDLLQRGVPLSTDFQSINDEQWVQLTLKARQVILC